MSIIKQVQEFLEQKEKKIITQNFVSLFLLQGANYILPLLILPFLVRILGAEKFGLIMFAQSLVSFLNVFVDFGFNISGTREISIARNQKQKVGEIFIAIMLIKFCLVVISFGVLLLLIGSFTRFSIDSNIYILSFGVVIGQACFPVWFFQGIEKMKVVTYVNVFAKIIFTVLVFFFIDNEQDYFKVPIYNSLGFIVSGFFGLIFSFKFFTFKLPTFGLIKQLFFDSFSLFISNLAISLYTASNVFILGLFSGNALAGVYSSIEKLILAIKNIYVPLYQALYPWVSRQNNEKVKMIICKIKPFVFLLGMVIAIFILCFAENILALVYKDPIITSYSIVFRVLCFISLFSGLNMLYNVLYFPAVKRYKVRMNILIFGGLFSVIMNLIFVQFFSIYGVAIIVTITELLLVLIGSFYFKKISSEMEIIKP
ncbi:oligosaccharide flippase family protein [Mangrovimonas sp. YM274]|uniref:oligosaccharide flippase family protein n=1 Tax=Mangrovimonas sp. YM274 TaxID=3070660 RepID=UPI0027DDA365|nr:oligosaccharide flippase family protein [Mangrovimonas sp. YM274]WMI68929.1 oligosaccharide flippase family protein [Mangrovimonas sp. YM274]